MSYLIYLRKSRADAEAEAHGQGETLARHEAILSELAEKQGLTVGDIYREVVSGETIASRPMMRRLLTEVEEGRWQGVIVMEVERLARGNTIDQGMVAQAFQYSGARIITPLKIYDPHNEFDEEYFEFGLFMSRREYKTINRRMQQGRAISAGEGKFIGSRAPYGYIRRKLADGKGYTLMPDPLRAQVVENIFYWYAKEGLGSSAIATRLNDMAIESANGGVWSASSVLDLLANPVYTGLICSGRRPTKKALRQGKLEIHRPKAAAYREYTGLHPAIISRELFNDARRIRESRSSLPAPRQRELKNPLAGLIRCELCGRTMVRRPQKNGVAYLLCPTAGCMTLGAPLEEVENAIISSLENWLGEMILSPDEGDAENQLFQRRVLRQIDKSLRDTENQLKTACDLLERGIYDEDTFRQRRKILQAKEKQLREGKSAVIRRLDETAEDTSSAPLLSYFAAYGKCDPTDKNRLLKKVLAGVDYHKISGGRWHKSDLALTLFPRLPSY